MSHLSKIDTLPSGASLERLPTCDFCKKPVNLCGSLRPSEFEMLDGIKKVKSWICDSCNKDRQVS